MSLGLMDGELFASVQKYSSANNLPSFNPREMKILDSLQLGKTNLLTKIYLSRINREGNVVKFSYIKSWQNFSKLKFLQEVKS